MPTDARLVICTFPDADRAAAVGRTLVEERLAACMNVLPGARSIYRWQGKVCDEPEAVALLKTTAARFDALRARLIELHPYDCPEVLALVVDDGNPAYLAWLAETCQPPSAP